MSTYLVRASSRIVALLIVGFLATLLAFPVFSSTSKGNIVVAVVEPRDVGSGLDYSVTINATKNESLKSILDALADNLGARLMLLVRADVPIGRMSDIASLASKAGYPTNRVSLFVFDADREAIMNIPGYKHFPFTQDGVRLGELAREAEN